MPPRGACAYLHVAIGDSQKGDHPPKLRSIGCSLDSAPHIRLSHHLKQRHTWQMA